ncbi:MAG: 16S rRNA (guanine(966)-N(2))-methyltransferase RsmD [Acidobacteria bacterium]|nr:16S rRNA (guanine(966)-N(2))-methyltransferase RsmD [Acidobacteriota bacterium]
MRVIGGEFRSRRLQSIPGMATRPTPDRLRETLFDILAPRIEGVVFVDAYAGTGAVGIEALSRGAARAVFIEKNRAAVEVLRANLAALGITDRAEVLVIKTAQAIGRFAGETGAGIVFLDPPYELDKEYADVMAALGANPPPLVIAQHSSHKPLDESYGALRHSRLVKQGENSLSFYRE